MTLQKLREKRKIIESVIDHAWDDVDREIAFVYLHDLGLRVTPIRRDLAARLFEDGQEGGKREMGASSCR